MKFFGNPLFNRDFNRLFNIFGKGEINMLNKAIEAITAQQPKLRNDIWMVGEQLKDLLRAEPQWSDMILQDLRNPNQSLEAVARQIREKASKNRVGNCGCVTPAEAEKIVRNVYGIPENNGEDKDQTIINLEDFF